MMRYLLSVLAILVLLVSGVLAQKPPAPTLEPTAPTEAQKQLINQGVALHDKGDFAGAIALYEEVLKQNPNNIQALYEMSYSYFAKKDYQKCVDAASRAAQYKSDLLGATYSQWGSCLDDMGKATQAIDVYQAGIKLSPSGYLLHFNLGLTYARLKQFDEARAVLKQAAVLKPDHASSHRLLSIVFNEGGYRIPALLAASRFLVLEPNSQRSEPALAMIRNVMQTGVTPAGDGKNISIVMDPTQKKDEGNFESVTLFMSLIKAADYSEESKNKSEMQKLVHAFESLFAMLSETDSKSDRKKFTWAYYAPYFGEMKKQGHVQAFTYYINQRSSAPEAKNWLNQNQSKVEAFLSWSKTYRWPNTN